MNDNLSKEHKAKTIMKIEQAINRVEAELQQWKQKEERFSRMFAFKVSDNRVFLKEKLRHYGTVAALFRDSINPEERLALRILRQERRRIEKQLYPKLWLRLLRRLTVEPIRRKHIARLQAREARRNEQTLKNALHKAGFGQVASKLQENIRQGLDRFSIPVSYHVNEKERMDFGLSFAKDQNGQYRFEGYRAALTGEDKPQESRQQNFPIQEGGVTATEAYHLLSGRALQPQSSPGEGKWTRRATTGSRSSVRATVTIWSRPCGTCP